jgi:hypothetical protein
MVPKGQSIHVLFLQAAVRLSACMLLFSAVAKVMQPSTWVVLQTALFWVVLVPVILNAFIGCSLMFSPVSRGWLIALFLVGIVYVGFHLLAGVAECDCFGSWVMLNQIAFYLAIASAVIAAVALAFVRKSTDQLSASLVGWLSGAAALVGMLAIGAVANRHVLNAPIVKVITSRDGISILVIPEDVGSVLNIEPSCSVSVKSVSNDGGRVTIKARGKNKSFCGVGNAVAYLDNGSGVSPDDLLGYFER